MPIFPSSGYVPDMSPRPGAERDSDPGSCTDSCSEPTSPRTDRDLDENGTAETAEDPESSGWSEVDLAGIGDTTELEVNSTRGDGTLRPLVATWDVRVGDAIYVRSAHGSGNGCLRRAKAGGTGRLRAAGIERESRSPSRVRLWAPGSTPGTTTSTTATVPRSSARRSRRRGSASPPV
ncbi:DUF2255 family protein [Pseudonocardia xinjiangensis]|uniref:DUF2255 family protein n=1 Tax=Pseudonocardia xinjiangensis TaxID=75289 RepID=UPI003D94A95B